MPIMAAFDSKIERNWKEGKTVMDLIVAELRRQNPEADEDAILARRVRIEKLWVENKNMLPRGFLCRLRLDREFKIN